MSTGALMGRSRVTEGADGPKKRAVAPAKLHVEMIKKLTTIGTRRNLSIADVLDRECGAIIDGVYAAVVQEMQDEIRQSQRQPGKT